jgi:hypothetical protein
MNCALCHRPLPVHTFPGAIPERQAVFTVRDGQRVHVPPCPPKPVTPATDTGD